MNAEQTRKATMAFLGALKEGGANPSDVRCLLEDILRQEEPMSWLERRRQWREEIARLEKLLLHDLLLHETTPPQSGDDQTHE